MAGRYADVLDLHGDPRHGRVAGATMAEAAAGDVRRRALTTVTDLAARIELVRAAAEQAGRDRNAVAVSTQIWFTAYGSAEQVRTAEAELAPGGRACRDSSWTAARTCCSAARPGWPRRCWSEPRPTGWSGSHSRRAAATPTPRTRSGSAARCCRC